MPSATVVVPYIRAALHCGRTLMPAFAGGKRQQGNPGASVRTSLVADVAALRQFIDEALAALAQGPPASVFPSGDAALVEVFARQGRDARQAGRGPWPQYLNLIKHYRRTGGWLMPIETEAGRLAAQNLENLRKRIGE